MNERMTICNMSIEAGGKAGMIAPDDTTYEFLAGRTFAPKGKAWDEALQYWRTLPSDADAKFDKEVELDAARVVPMVTWGTNPEQVIADHRTRSGSGTRARSRTANRVRQGAVLYGPAARHAR